MFNKALESDPKNPFAHFALGYDRVAIGDWQAARPHLARAAELSPDDSYFTQYFFMVRLALGEAAAAEQDARETLRKKPMDYSAELHLVQALITQGNRDAAMKEISDCEGVGVRRGVRGQDPLLLIKCYVLYGLGDFSGLEKAVVNDKTAEGRLALTWALIEQGRLDEALKLAAAEDDADQKPWHFAPGPSLAPAPGKTTSPPTG